jgi:hypothetical protein
VSSDDAMQIIDERIAEIFQPQRDEAIEKTYVLEDFKHI